MREGRAQASRPQIDPRDHRIQELTTLIATQDNIIAILRGRVSTLKRELASAVVDSPLQVEGMHDT